jgi:hypothetical protein
MIRPLLLASVYSQGQRRFAWPAPKQEGARLPRGLLPMLPG